MLRLTAILLMFFSFLTFNSSVLGNPEESQTAGSLIETSGKRTTEKIKAEEVAKIIKEAASAYSEVNRIIFLISHNKTEEGEKLLKQLIDRLEKLTKKHKDVKELPINVFITEIDGITDIDQAEELVKELKKAINNNDFITARYILDTLRNEIIVETVNLPLDLFTETVKLAYRFLKEGKIDSAVSQLKIATDTVDIEKTIIPKPLSIALLLIEDASKIFKKDPDIALKLLKEAKRQIKLAKVLGYVTSDREIKPLITQIEKLEKSVSEKKGTQENFKSLFKSVEEFKTKSEQTQ